MVASTKRNHHLLLFFAAIACLGVTSGIFETIFNNYLIDVFHMGADVRGRLEFPRELPGFLVALLAGSFFFLRESRLGALAAVLNGLGLIGLAHAGADYTHMIAGMLLWSTGMHLFMPMGHSLALSLAKDEQRATRMGQMSGVTAAAVICGCGLVWLGMEKGHLNYSALFLTAGSSAVLGGLILTRMAPLARQPENRPKLIFRRRYGLYYLLELLFGARKQVFITFGPLVLIKVCGQPASTIAKLWIIASALGIVFRPTLGWMIDKLGERIVLMTDALLLVAICLGYGYSQTWGLGVWGLRLVYLCFICDHLLFGMEMARSTYLSKIVLRREDLTASLSLGVSINHVASMSIPTLGGLLWVHHGYQSVFLGAAAVAIVTLFVASFIRVPSTGEPAEVAILSPRAEPDMVIEPV